MSGRWFRFYDEALDDPKVQRLSPHLFKAWVNLLCLASKEAGKLPSNDDISFRLRISAQDAEQITSDLIIAGLIDLDPQGRRSMHNWEGRQYASDTSAERMRKHRAKKKKDACDGDSDVTVTVQNRTDSDTETDSDQKPRERAKAKFDFEGLAGSPAGEVERELLTRTEGLGINAKSLEFEATRPGIKNPSAYFQSLVRKRLREMAPGLSDDAIGRGLCGDRKAYGDLMNIILMTETASGR